MTRLKGKCIWQILSDSCIDCAVSYSFPMALPLECVVTLGFLRINEKQFRSVVSRYIFHLWFELNNFTCKTIIIFIFLWTPYYYLYLFVNLLAFYLFITKQYLELETLSPVIRVANLHSRSAISLRSHWNLPDRSLYCCDLVALLHFWMLSPRKSSPNPR